MTEDNQDLLPFRLSICGLDELAALAGAGISHVVSILDPEWPDPEAFAAYPDHRRETFRFDDVIYERPGYVWPRRADIENILRFAGRLPGEAVHHLLIHCHAGVSRSTAAAVIVMAALNGGREAEMFDLIDGLRPRSWPNSLMIGLADEMLDRDGALLGAMRAHHARVAARHPDLAEIIRLHGRAHEVPGLAQPPTPSA
ncbi:MAG: protein-tyrosine-phosphatase [Alphaproteobacteria bacterium]|nr:protein-tyrosine-phosphatase [Alphaproteobacteria bacterium]MDP6516672.1 protein-tyrosine-phosphatase [Alphaproteobacteria bacterium]